MTIAGTQGRGPGTGPDAVVDGVWRLALPNPPGHMPSTACYLVETADGGFVVVDPGWDTDENLVALEAALTTVRPGAPLTAIVLTHLHPDHGGLAPRLRAAHDAPVLCHAREVRSQRAAVDHAADVDAVRAEVVSWGVPDGRVDEVVGFARRAPRVVMDADGFLEDGDLVSGTGLRVLLTPGHTPGHVCLADEERRFVLMGDHVLPDLVPGIGLGLWESDDPLESYLDGLERLIALGAPLGLPGHGELVATPAERARECGRHHLRRTAEVAAAVADAPDATTWETAAGLTWSRGWDGLTRHYLVSALRQTAMHARLVRSGRHEDLLARWA